MRRLLLPSLGAALLSTGCGDDPVPLPPVPVEVGPSFRVRVYDDDRLVVASADGRVLLDGLLPAGVADDASPLAGFALRDVATSYEMQFGAFRPSDAAAGPWRVAERLVVHGADVDLADHGGATLATLRMSAPEPGHLVVDLVPGAGPERRLSWGFACDAADHFNGLGAQTWDVDHRGQTVPAFVEEQGIGKDTTDVYSGPWFLVGRRHSSYMPLPEVLARRGYLLAAETPDRAIFALCSERADAARVEVELPSRIHVFDGPDPARSIERATATLGRPRMPPRIAFAPWLDAIFGSENVRRVATKLRDQGVPSSVIWTEDWRGGDWSGDNYALKEEWSVDTSLYPDLPALTGELHAEGFAFHVYFNSFVYVGSKAWAETEPHGWLVKHPDGTDYTFPGAKLTDTGLLDLDNPDARAWAVAQMRSAMKLGADGWMNDFAEWLPTDAKTAAGLSYSRHNHYAVQWEEVAREAIDGAGDGKERLFFGRSGWLGSPPLADVIWAGDQRTTFDADDGMPTILPIGIGLGVAGVSTFGHDIGGYQSLTNAGSTKELFFRWTELGAWSPVMRTHHGAQPKLEWSWEKDDETIAHFRRYAKLHMALVPYLEGLARVAHETGMPMWRGLGLEPGAAAELWAITDEVMLGPNVLVAPVVASNVTSRKVRLPPGRWFAWAGGAPIAGATSIDALAPLEEIPVYARAGAVVPMYPDGVMTLAKGSPSVPDATSVGDDRVVLAFAGAAGSFQEANGLSYALEAISAASDAVRWADADLPACASPAVAPCAEIADGVVTAHVVGPGVLEVPASAAGTSASRVTVEGGGAARKLRIIVRR